MGFTERETKPAAGKRRKWIAAHSLGVCTSLPFAINSFLVQAHLKPKMPLRNSA
jgi:hypothetical protein